MAKRFPTPLWVVVPGDLETRTGGYGYDRRMIAGLRETGWDVRVVRLDTSFPCPTDAARDEARRALAAVPDGGLVLFDGLALGALPDEVSAEASRLALVALVHHPLALETGLDARRAADLEDTERRALIAVRHVVVTSRGTAATLARYNVEPHRITVVEPGTDPAPLAQIHQQPPCAADQYAPRASASAAVYDSMSTAHQHPLRGSSDAVVHLLCVASLTPRKGYEILLDALASVPHDHWRLRCAGSDRDAESTTRVRARLRNPRLAARVELIGDMDGAQLAREYEAADLFVLATLYEGYGMVVAEALARGLPIVSTRTGAIADLVGDSAGITVEPGDSDTLRDALTRVIADPALRARLAAGARDVRDRLPTWNDSVARLARVLARARDAANG
ncbi:MAG TPA: glycosyltransferase family 4 protein [Vicinamibacterales bacterium]|nr:glycosyltransferase family 4 protein [Vicinamibacterales bacterium]